MWYNNSADAGFTLAYAIASPAQRIVCKIESLQDICAGNSVSIAKNG